MMFFRGINLRNGADAKTTFSDDARTDLY